MSQVMNSAWYNGEVLDSSVLPGHMAKLCDKAHKSRAKDKTRNYALYNSLKGVQTRGDETPPPKIPFALVTHIISTKLGAKSRLEENPSLI